MSPYWVHVVLRGDMKTRNHICMKMSQTRSSQMSFLLLHKTEFHRFLRCIEFGELAWLNSQCEVSFTCESVQLLVAELFCCVSRPGMFTWFFLLRRMLFIIAFKIFGVGRVGATRNHLPAEVPVSWTSCFVAAFNMCLILREEGSEMSTFCWALHLSSTPDLLSLTEAPHRRQCCCLALAWLIAPVYFCCCAATGGAKDPVFPAGPSIMPTDLSPPEKKMFLRR